MYIGPWQEFKLAKILQLKDKVDKEQEQENQMIRQQDQQMQAHYGQKPGKAYSVGTRMGGAPPHNLADQQSSYSNMSGMSMPVGRLTQNDSVSLQRAREHQMHTMQSMGADNMHKYQVEKQYRQKKNVPLLLPNGQTVMPYSPENRPPRKRKVPRSDPTRNARKSEGGMMDVMSQGSG